MKQIQPDLWETEVETPFPGLHTHAYLLQRDDGNVLFYNTGRSEEIEAMARLGGVAYQYLSHLDEAGESLNAIAARFGAELGGHVREVADLARFRRPTILFERRETHLGNIEVIPTPGHSPGSTCFYVRSPHGRYLFTGDTLWFNAERVLDAAFLVGRSDRDAYLHSLALLRTLAPELVISSATGGQGGYLALAPGEWPGHVDRARTRLQRGECDIG